jgi:hypothetical protein
MGHCTVTFWYIEGYENVYKLSGSDKLSMLNSDIICLVETWNLSEINFGGEFAQFTSLQQVATRVASRGRGKGGIITLFWAKDFEVLDTRKSGYYIFSSLRHIKTREILLLANMYIPPAADNVVTECFNNLSQWTEDRLHEKLIVIGDLNARLRAAEGISVTFKTFMNYVDDRATEDCIQNAQGREVLQAIEDLDLTVMNGRSAGDKEGAFTFVGPNVSSIIDICMGSYRIMQELRSFTVQHNALSYHNPIQLSLGHDLPTTELVKDQLQWNQNKATEYREMLSTNHVHSIDELCMEIKRAAKQLNMTIKPIAARNQPWFDKECQVKRKELGQAKTRYKKSAYSEIARQSCYQCRRNFRTMIRDKKASHMQLLKDRINNSRNPGEFWRAVKSMRRSNFNSNPVTEFYASILPEKSKYTPFEGTLDPDLDDEISENELHEALSKIKARKAMGPDGIPSEFYKELFDDGKKSLLLTINAIFKSEIIPQQWGESTTVMLHKKGDVLDPNNYRPITLLNASMKIFMHILTARLTKWANKFNILPEEQAEFRASRG